MGSVEGDIESTDDIRGPFAPVKYVNFLNEGKKGTPIFGSELASGSGTLGKLILGSANGLHSPPVVSTINLGRAFSYSLI
jgi:hypothetical protein